MTTYKLREKRNPLALHGIFESRERAEHHLTKIIPIYVDKGFFSDKSLRADDFEIVESSGKDKFK
jgi:hypothetical protein